MTDRFRYAVPCARVKTEVRAILGQKYEIRLVMRDDARRNVAEMFENVTDVEPARESRKQLVKRVELIERVLNGFDVYRQGSLHLEPGRLVPGERVRSYRLDVRDRRRSTYRSENCWTLHASV